MAEIKAFDADGVSGFLHIPDFSSGNGLVLTQGTGGNCQSPLLLAMSGAFASAGVN